MRSRVRDEDWERLGKAWCAARVGSPPRIREQQRSHLSRAWQSPARTPSFSPSSVPWRNPGDRHEPSPYEEHTIATAQHASSVLARHPHHYEPVPRTAPQPRRASPLRARAGEGRIELLTPDGVVAWLDTLFQHDDEERRRLRHEAIRQAGASHLRSAIPMAFPDGVYLQIKLARAGPAARRCRRGFPPTDCDRREAVHVRAASDTAAGPATRGGSAGSGWQRRDPSGENSQKYSSY